MALRNGPEMFCRKTPQPGEQGLTGEHPWVVVETFSIDGRSDAAAVLYMPRS